MASGTYFSKSMTQPQLSLLKTLDELELDIFTLEELKKQIPIEKLDSLVENLVHKQVLSRIERGKYCRATFRNEHVIGAKLIPDGVVGYWSALNLHGLTDQFPNKVFIQTRFTKKDKTVFGVMYKFVSIDHNKIGGITVQGRGNHIFFMTDKEKTILDCFDHPEYSGGYEELIKAFIQTPLNEKKLIEYAQIIKNKAAVKRLGYLAQLTSKEEFSDFIQYAKTQVNTTYSLMDSMGSNEGEFVLEWKLRLNVSKDNLLKIGGKAL